MNAFSIKEHRALYAGRGPTMPPEDYKTEDYRFRDLTRLDQRVRTKSGCQMHLFYNKNEGIGPEEVRAAFAYPFIYPPVIFNDEVWFEGAARDPINFGNLLVDASEGRVRKAVPDIERIVLIDILGSLDQFLLREPRDLLDAFSLSILVPAVAHAQKELARFYNALSEANEDLKMFDESGRQRAGPARREAAFKKLKPADQALAQITHFKQMYFDIDAYMGPHITEWNYSNMAHLFEIGRRDGKKFWERNLEDLALPEDPRQKTVAR
jgi:hypothetical protein